MPVKKLRFSHVIVGLVAVLLFLAAGPLHFWQVSGAVLTGRALKLSNDFAGATSKYDVSFNIISPSVLGSIRVQFCANDPFVGEPCTPSPGLDISAATLSDQTGMGGYSIDSADSTANVLVLTRLPTLSVLGVSSYELDGVINPSAPGSYYARVETFASADATGPDVDYGGLAYSINGGISIKTKVPPYLLMCTGDSIPSFDCSTASGDYIDFGELSSNATATGSAQILVATNAEFGYTISALGPTMTSGNNIIPALASADVSRPGTSQFGLNLRANSTPSMGVDPQGSGVGQPTSGYNQPNLFQYIPGDVIANRTYTDAYRRFTASYIVNVSKSQPPGVYVTTITYVALASF
ncbi:MAG: hypothetical protein ABI220_01990 [Candidatus Saccharimonadales bacterium]